MVMDAGLDNAGQDNEEGEETGQARAGARARGRCLPDPQKLAQDWITLWQSELSAMAADPEMQEAWQAIIALWAGSMSALLRGLPRAERPNHAGYNEHRPARPARPADAPGAAPAAAAPDPRDAEIERLARHVAALERRLAGLERGGDPAVHPKGGSRGGKRRG